MYEAICYDLNGQTIDYFTQWDTNQKIVIRLEGCGDDYHVEGGELQTVPEVHFTNIKRDTALAVKATLDGNDIVVDVPNLILEEPYPVLIYVWYTNKEHPNSQSTIARTEIAVRQKNKPHDYYYVENITTETAEAIKQEVHDRVLNEITDDVADLKTEMQEQLDANNGRMDAIENSILNKENEDSVVSKMADIENSILNVENSDSVVSQMNDIKTSFSTTETKVNEAVEYINTYIDSESRTITANKIKVGDFVWISHPDRSMSFSWVGGEV